MGCVMKSRTPSKCQTLKRAALTALLAAACLGLTSCGSLNSLFNYLIKLPGNICKTILP